MADTSPPTRVVNVMVPGVTYDVYIGRPNRRFGLNGKWGNPFSHKAHANAILCDTREEAITRYRDWLLGRPELLAAIPELKGKTLGCWCRPAQGFRGKLYCHGQILAALADGIDPLEVE